MNRTSNKCPVVRKPLSRRLFDNGKVPRKNKFLSRRRRDKIMKNILNNSNYRTSPRTAKRHCRTRACHLCSTVFVFKENCLVPFRFDHCHDTETGKNYRGTLCSSCNRLEGGARSQVAKKLCIGNLGKPQSGLLSDKALCLRAKILHSKVSEKLKPGMKLSEKFVLDFLKLKQPQFKKLR